MFEREQKIKSPQELRQEELKDKFFSIEETIKNIESKKELKGSIGSDGVIALELYINGLLEKENINDEMLNEAEEQIERLFTIDREAKSDKPDVDKMDSILSEFLYGRIQHYINTYDQRIKMAAESLQRSYSDKSDLAKEMKAEGQTVEQWEVDLRKRLPDMKIFLRNIEEESKKDWKARHLTELGKWVREESNVLGDMSNPFSPDDIIEEGKYRVSSEII